MGKLYCWTLTNSGAYYQQRPFRENDFDGRVAPSRNSSWQRSPGFQPFSEERLPANPGRPILRPLPPSFGENSVSHEAVRRCASHRGTRPEYSMPQVPKHPSSHATRKPVDGGSSTAARALPDNDGAAQEPRQLGNGALRDVHLKVRLDLRKLSLPRGSSMPRNVPSKVPSLASVSSETRMPPCLPVEVQESVDLLSKMKGSVLRRKIPRHDGTNRQSSAAARIPVKPAPNHEMAERVPTVEVIRQHNKKAHHCKRVRVLRAVAVDDLVEDVSDVSLEEYCEGGTVSGAKRCRNAHTKAGHRPFKPPAGMKRKIPRLDDAEDVSDTPLEENESRSPSSVSAKAKPETQTTCPKKTHNVGTAPPRGKKPLSPVPGASSSKSRSLSRPAHLKTGSDEDARGNGAKIVAQQGARKVDARLQGFEGTDSSVDLELPSIKIPNMKAGLEKLGSTGRASHKSDLVSGLQRKDILGSTQACEINASGAPDRSIEEPVKPSVGVHHIKAPRDSSNPEKSVQQGGCTSSTKKASAQEKQKYVGSSRMKGKLSLNSTKPTDAAQKSCVPHKTKAMAKKTQMSTNVKHKDDTKDCAFVITRPLKSTEKQYTSLSKTAVVGVLKETEPANTQTQGSHSTETDQTTSEKIENPSGKQPEVPDTGGPKKDKLRNKQIQDSQATNAKRTAPSDKTEKIINTSSKVKAAFSLKSMKSPSSQPQKDATPAPTAKKAVNLDLKPTEAKHAGNSNDLQIKGIVQPESHSALDTMGTAPPKKAEQNPGPLQVKMCSLKGPDPTDLRTARKRSRSLSETEDRCLTGAKHVQKGEVSSITQASPPGNPKKRRASVSEIEQPNNMQGTAHDIGAGSSEKRTKPLNKKKRSTSLSEVDHARCEQNLKLLDNVLSQGTSTSQAKQLAHSVRVNGGKQIEHLGRESTNLSETDKAHNPEDLKSAASTSSQEICSFHTKQPCQPSTVDINANVVEVQSTCDLRDKAEADTMPTEKECTSDTLKTAPPGLKNGTTTACKPEEALDSREDRQECTSDTLKTATLGLENGTTTAHTPEDRLDSGEEKKGSTSDTPNTARPELENGTMTACKPEDALGSGEVKQNLQLHDTMIDSENGKPCTLQLHNASLNSDDLNTHGYQLQDTKLGLGDVKACDLQLSDELISKEVKPPYLQLKAKIRSNKNNASLYSGDLKPHGHQLQDTELGSGDVKAGDLQLHEELISNEVKPPYLQLDVKIRSNKKVKKRNSSGTNTSMRSVWCFSRRKKTKKVLKKKTDEVSSSTRTVRDTESVAPARTQVTDDGTELAPDGLHLERLQCDDSTAEDIQEAVTHEDKLPSIATVETIAQCSNGVMDPCDDSKETTASVRKELHDAVPSKEDSLSRNVLEQKDETATLADTLQLKASGVALQPKATMVALQCKDTAALQPRAAMAALQCKESMAPLQSKDSGMALQPKNAAVATWPKDTAATMYCKDTLPGSLNAPQGEATTAGLLQSSLLDLDLTTGLSILDVCQTDSVKLKEFRDRARGDNLSKERAMRDIAKAVHDAIVEEYFKRERAVRTLKLLAKIPFSKDHNTVIRTRQLIQAVVANAMDDPKSAP